MVGSTSEGEMKAFAVLQHPPPPPGRRGPPRHIRSTSTAECLCARYVHPHGQYGYRGAYSVLRAEGLSGCYPLPAEAGEAEALRCSRELAVR